MSQQNLPIHFEETEVTELLQASLRPLIEHAKRERIELHIAKLGQIPRLHVDREKLAWAVTALVGNALRYVAHGNDGEAEVGGSVVVHVTREDGSDSVSISVQDDGPGIPDDKLPFLFERRHGAVHADGLALSLVRQIVAAHGGRIEVESRRDPDDHGTSITIALPIRH
ncbi:MAG TPA: HAMP domain-containing sensor histidine kinase [Labilithrix sp.]|jgi:signal transduction histidine kinase|nr:HAMP domain-containing sensor histidine kinase [Labilithrix sp.]